MTRRASNLRLLALILAIGAGLLLEARADDTPDLADHDRFETAEIG
ncbi:hypothetical protein [Jannaschia formosa]|nr:hypothetical protein [Jannaschia formosa]